MPCRECVKMCVSGCVCGLMGVEVDKRTPKKMKRERKLLKTVYPTSTFRLPGLTRKKKKKKKSVRARKKKKLLYLLPPKVVSEHRCCSPLEKTSRRI